jgi:hypothetical protein
MALGRVGWELGLVEVMGFRASFAGGWVEEFIS